MGLMPFIPAGYPDLRTTAALLPALEAGGASLIEIGFPFSDPIADGPTIQAAFTHALKQGVKVHDVLDTVRQVRSKLSIPLVAMLSYSIVFRYGQERFFADLSSAGFDGLIIPDLPPPEAQKVCGSIRKAGLDTVLLVSPSSSLERRKEIVGLCSGFVYYLSVSGITGERDRLPADLEKNVREVRSISPTPVCVGFGISRPEHMAQLSAVADGAIVGSALVRKISQHADAKPDAIAEVGRQYCSELLAGL
jgi:tryptophan synthase alpha chain